MAKYRKKPVVIEAVMWTGMPGCLADIETFTGQTFEVDYTAENPPIIIHTLEGDMRADIGDFIIKGVKGEFYPCKPDIFWKTYEPVPE